MKPEEAIEILDEVKELDDSMYAYNPKYMDAVDMAIEALKEVQLYRLIKDVTIGEIAEVLKEFSKIGTVEECREAVEKQTPKAPDYEGDGYDNKGELIYDTWICQNCGERYEVDYDDYEHCPKCGQAIQWENLEGMEDRK